MPASLCWLRSPLNPLASGFVPQTPHLQGLCVLQTLSPHVSSSHSEAFTAGWGTLHSAGPGHRASSAGTGGGWSSGRGARTPDSRKPAQGRDGCGPPLTPADRPQESLHTEETGLGGGGGRELPQALEVPGNTPTLHTGPGPATVGSRSAAPKPVRMRTGSAAPTWLVQALHRYTQVPSPTLSTLRDDQSTRFR